MPEVTEAFSAQMRSHINNSTIESQHYGLKTITYICSERRKHHHKARDTLAAAATNRKRVPSRGILTHQCRRPYFSRKLLYFEQ